MTIISIEDNFKSPIQDIRLSVLEEQIIKFNARFKFSNIDDLKNPFLIDFSRVKTIVENKDQLPDLGELQISNSTRGFMNNMTNINVLKLHEIKWVKLFEGDRYLEFKALRLPFENSQIVARKKEIEDDIIAIEQKLFMADPEGKRMEFWKHSNGKIMTPESETDVLIRDKMIYYKSLDNLMVQMLAADPKNSELENNFYKVTNTFNLRGFQFFKDFYW